MRVLTDVVAVDREFDYEVPASWHCDGRAAKLAVGTMVRVMLKGRRVGGWVTACDPAPETAATAGTEDPGETEQRPGGEDGEQRLALDFAGGEPSPARARTPAGSRSGAGRPSVTSGGAGSELQPVRKLVGAGPSAAVLDLARWAARRWVGRRATFVGTASPPRVIEAAAPPTAVATSARTPETPSGAAPDRWEAAFAEPVSVVRIPPAGDRGPFLAAALRRGDALLIAPLRSEAVRLAAWVRRSGVPVALLPEDWALAAAGGVVVGTRAAVFGPCPRPASIVVLDEHDEALVAEDSPTWSAREVAVERARRAGVPCVLVSPVPTLEAQLLATAASVVPPRGVEREGWPNLEIVDQRDPEVSRHGLLSGTLVERLRAGGRAVCVLNRRGRARLLACTGCGELVVCDSCGAAVGEGDRSGELGCRRCGETRPRVCSRCGATRLRVLRPGIARLREELEMLMGEPVAEVSGRPQQTPDRSAPTRSDARIVIGTEAALHRGAEADLVAFLDFDQELSAARYRANEQALALLARAARLVGPRSGGGRILVQTRQVDHPVVQAAGAADPDLLSSHDRLLRRQLGLPPYGTLVEIAGTAAQAFVERLGRPDAVTIVPAGENRWVATAADRDRLLDALNAVERPPGRLRLAVDPLRF